MRRLALLVIGLLTMVQCAVLAAEPPAAKKAEASVPAVAEDPRIDKKFTYSCEGKRLDKVLPEITKQTQVVIGVDPSKRFWSVRQTRVTLFLKDMSLKEFMTQLEALLDYHFTRQGEPGKYTYTLWQNMNGRKKEQGIIAAGREARTELKQRAVYETLADCRRALGMSPDQIEQAKKTDPWLAYLATDPRMREFASLICALPQDMYGKLLRDDSLWIDLPQLSPEARAAVDRIEAIERPEAEKQSWKENGKFTLSSLAINPTSSGYGLVLWAKPNDQSTPTKQHTVINVSSFDIARSDGAPRLRGTVLVNLMSDGMTKDEAEKKISQALADGDGRGESSEDILNRLLGRKQPEKVEAGEADPDLEKPIKLDVHYDSSRNDYLKQVFEKLPEQTRLNLMYECLNTGEQCYYAGIYEQKLSEMLNGLSLANGFEWAKSGKNIRLRCKDWAERRSWEIRDDLIRTWRASIEKNNGLIFDDLCDMATTLTDKQIEHNFDYNKPEWSMLGNPKLSRLFATAGATAVKMMRSPLEFYDSLTPSQRNMLLSKDGLPIEMVPVEKWPRINGAAQLWDDNVPIYDAVFLAQLGTKEDPKDHGARFTMRAKVWLADLPPDMRERHLADLARNSPEKLKRIDNEPTEIEMGNGFGYGQGQEAVKKLVEEIRKDEAKEAAEKKAGAASKQQVKEK